jgi:hypothetical protein
MKQLDKAPSLKKRDGVLFLVDDKREYNGFAGAKTVGQLELGGNKSIQKQRPIQSHSIKIRLSQKLGRLDKPVQKRILTVLREMFEE